MQGKIALAAGFVAGYVLGSKAGRQRYEEIVAQARKVAGNQTVQSTAGVLQAQASDLVTKAKQSDIVTKAKQTVGREGGDPPTYSSATYESDLPRGSDLFEPSDPLNPTNPTSANGSNP